MRFTVEEFNDVIFGKKPIHVAKDKVEKSYTFLEHFAKDKIVYGINTGFGPMAQHRISEDKLIDLQYNLIRSHSSGAGVPLSEEECRAIVLARMISLARGQSGVHPSVIELLETFLNEGISPVVYEHGGVGASGDLIQLAHLALSLIGEGEAYHQGTIESTAKIFSEKKITPIHIYIREGLGLINGTSGMTGVGLVNLFYAEKILYWSILFSSMINELVETFDDHFSEELNKVKNHKGQNEVARMMRLYLQGSKKVLRREDHLYKKLREEVFEKKVQEYYSLRCVPQILGPVHDTLTHCQNILIEELNSVNDNPIIDAENQNIYHGGNFHGDYVSLEMDKLKMVIAKLCILAERQINFLVNPALNKILPPFVNMGVLGLNLGVQGMIFTATSTTAENQTLSYPNYVHSIPNNNDNQDIVSMGSNSARICRKVIDNTFQVLAIQALTIIQAIEIVGGKEKMAPRTRTCYENLREIVPVFIEDSVKYKDIQKLTDYLKNHTPER